MNKSERKEFKQFLKQHMALAGFKHNLKKEGTGFKTCCKSTTKYYAISTEFEWYNTPEGYDYWKELNNLWENQCITNS